MPSSKERAVDPAQKEDQQGALRNAAASHSPDEIRRELDAILDSSEFRGSHRGQMLLRYLVENALKGGVERLKERTIGVELFHREASYDTGQDAIVRVAANDVRKRLNARYQHLDPAAHAGTKVRISLAPGSYIPDFETAEEVLPAPAEESVPLPQAPARVAGKWSRGWAPWAIAAGLAAMCGLLIIQDVELRVIGSRPARLAILPWSQLAAPGATVTLVAADVNFALYKSLVHADLPLAVYTSQPWLGEIANRVPSLSDLSRMTLTSIADASVAARIGNVLRSGGSSIAVRSGRMTQVGDFKSDRSAILLGSAYANPWVALWSERLNFRIEYDPVLEKQVCKNASPRPGESPTYIGTAHTPQPGVAYAIISLAPNLSGDGFVLIIGGTNMEGTEAAGELVTDLPRLASALRRRGIDPAAKVGQLELLMRVDHMNNQSSRSEIIAHRVTR
jgi:hypothetical protein